MERLTFTDAEMKNIGENFDCPVRDNPLVDRFCEEMCAKFQADCPYKEMGKKLKAYEDAEEQGLLLRLPCKVGDTIFVVPSKTNYDLNILNGFEFLNKIYEQKVHSIKIYGSERYVIFTCNGLDSVVAVSYKETWFLTKEEAKQKLAEMKGESHEAGT